jgi:hypothetical protein
VYDAGVAGKCFGLLGEWLSWLLWILSFSPLCSAAALSLELFEHLNKDREVVVTTLGPTGNRRCERQICWAI